MLCFLAAALTGIVLYQRKSHPFAMSAKNSAGKAVSSSGSSTKKQKHVVFSVKGELMARLCCDFDVGKIILVDAPLQLHLYCKTVRGTSFFFGVNMYNTELHN